MAALRFGNPTAFWNNVSAGANSTSAELDLARFESLSVYVSVSGATTITVETAISSGTTSPDQPNQASDVGENWGAVKYLDVSLQHVFAGAGSIVLLIPDWVAGWVRLRTSAAATITAGYEGVLEN